MARALDNGGKHVDGDGRAMEDLGLEELLATLASGGGQICVQRQAPGAVAWLKPDLELPQGADAQDILDALHNAHGGGTYLLRPRKDRSSKFARGSVRVTLAGEPRAAALPSPAPVMMAPPVAAPLDRAVLDLVTRPQNVLLEALTRMVHGQPSSAVPPPPPSTDVLVRLVELLAARSSAPPPGPLEEQLRGLQSLLAVTRELQPRPRRRASPPPPPQDDLRELTTLLGLFGQRPPAPYYYGPPQVAPLQASPLQASPPQASPPQASPPQVSPPQASPPQASPPQASPQASPQDEFWSPEELAGEVAALSPADLQRFLAAVAGPAGLQNLVAAEKPADKVTSPPAPPPLNLNFKI